jgi:uncharacterized protein DUF6491
MRNGFPGYALAACALLSACAAGPQQKSSQDLALERYSAYAGPPIPSFWWPGRFDSWEALGKDHVAVFTTPFDAYLLKVQPPCDMRFLFNTLALTTTSSTVYAHLDAVLINSAGTGPGRWQCPIDEIRKVDYRRMSADRKAARAPGAAGAGVAPAAVPPPAEAAPAHE